MKHRRAIEDLLLIEKSGHIVSCATDGMIICWDYTAEAVLHVIEQREEFISIAFKKSTGQVVVGTESSKVMTALSSTYIVFYVPAVRCCFSLSRKASQRNQNNHRH